MRKHIGATHLDRKAKNNGLSALVSILIRIKTAIAIVEAWAHTPPTFFKIFFSGNWELVLYAAC